MKYLYLNVCSNNMWLGFISVPISIAADAEHRKCGAIPSKHHPTFNASFIWRRCTLTGGYVCQKNPVGKRTHESVRTIIYIIYSVVIVHSGKNQYEGLVRSSFVGQASFRNSGA